MIKRLIRTLCIVMALGMLLTMGAFAAEVPSAPDVRVNGMLVSFPDAGPFIDENSRTMIPVRFVAENLGAQVSWDQATKTASIEKAGVIVEITIGKADLRVIRNGNEETVTMDTAAVLKDSRTYVPIRFVAESLGAYVDYSDTYRTVGIYSDVLTPEQIKALQALPYTQPSVALGYDEAKTRYNAEDMEFFYGTGRESFDTFANAREHLYRIRNLADADTLYKDIVDKAVAAMSCDTEHMTVRFLTDTSCIYQPDDMDRLICTVRGIAEVNLRANPQKLAGEETAFLCRLGFTQLNVGTMYIPVDAHMNTEGTLNTIAPAGTAY